MAAKPQLAASIHAQVEAMQRAFPEACITGHEPLIDALMLPDANDRHVLAAAIRCGAQHIVTDNLTDFPNEILNELAIEAIDADEFLSRTFDLYSATAIEALKIMRQSYRDPAFTQSEFVFDLTAKGLPKLASRVRPARALL